ncbi:MAG: DUF1854 domain-containing protein [Limnohabitans sp.]|nr:DUF1854 domain-containing protein [Limnohabitans sp.]
MSGALFELKLDKSGHWQLRLGDELHHGVVVVRAFPIGAPDEAVSILSAEGHELLWLPEPLQLPLAQKEAVLAALQAREFMPEIQRVDAVSSFTTPSTWSVQTHRGFTQFVLRGEEDIRRISSKTLIVADEHGVQFLIRDLPALDRHSRKLLDRFL